MYDCWKFFTKKINIVSCNKTNIHMKKSILNINNVIVLPVVGMNVYDILKFNNLIISKDALIEVEKRLIWSLKKKKKKKKIINHLQNFMI